VLVQYSNLIIATGGSFTRAKDLPSIGRTIATIINGVSAPERYRWHPQTPPPYKDQPHLVGRGNFDCLVKQAEDHHETASGDHGILSGDLGIPLPFN
jgi:hypothetical protein